MPDMAESRKNKYRWGDKEACARYMVFKALDKSKVPVDLFPLQTDKAEKIIRDG
jgi:hypothetical protein